MRFVSSALLLLSLTANAESFMPQNHLHLFDQLHFRTNTAGMDQAKFNQITDSVINYYAPYARELGGTLVANKRWTDSTVNASANQLGTRWDVTMYGGLARRPEITPDGFAMVVCHEVGHHMGGFPMYPADWAASEGQADYFALQTCSRAIWGGEKEENAKHRATVHATAKAKCDTVYSGMDDQNLCYRAANASQSLANLLAALERGTTPSFDTPDTRAVTETNVDHPAAQCRLDTYFAAALCTAQFDPRVIPGRRHTKGQDSIEAEQDAARYSCTSSAGYRDGLRSACWFKARL